MAKRVKAGGFSGEKLLAKQRTQKLLRTFRSLGVGSSMVEQLPFKQLVLGSNPSQPTMLRPAGLRMAGHRPAILWGISPFCLCSPIVICRFKLITALRLKPDFPPTYANMKRLVIVEDQTAIREMLAEILRLDPNYKLVGESGDGQSAQTLCLEVKPDLLVLDAKLPGLNGVDLLRRLSKQLKHVRVLVFS